MAFRRILKQIPIDSETAGRRLLPFVEGINREIAGINRQSALDDPASLNLERPGSGFGIGGDDPVPVRRERDGAVIVDGEAVSTLSL